MAMTTEASIELDFSAPPCLHVISAFLAMEPPDIVISFARDCGRGLISDRVQHFIWERCINRTDDVSAKGNTRFSKTITFIFPRGSSDLPSCPKSRKLEVLLHCSVNLLEGDTGCSIWPSCLFLSEFVLSFPELFTNKSCFEVGSGVGLVGICLAHIKASKVILSDGDLSTLANMRLNLESNKINASNDFLEHTVQCLYLPWESAAENGLQQINPDIVLGADVIYDPLCLPHLVQVLAVLLNREGLQADDSSNDGCLGKSTRKSDGQNVTYLQDGLPRSPPVAYIASVVRNITTFNCFLALANEANLSVLDITEKAKPFSLLPYAKSYQPSSIKLLCISYLRK